MKVRNYITKHPKISPRDLAVKARAVMRKNNVRALPVFDKDKLVGIITRSDILKISSSKSNITVGGLLWKPLMIVQADSSVEDAITLLLAARVKQLPVFDKREYLGLIRDVDLLKAVLELRKKPKRKFVKEVMNKRVIKFSPKDPMDKAWFAMKDHSGFPIVHNDKLIGILTSREMLARQSSRLVRESGKIKTPANIETVMRIIRGREKDFILSPSTKLEKASEKILKADSNILLVFDKKLVGIVTKKDLLRGYVKK